MRVGEEVAALAHDRRRECLDHVIVLGDAGLRRVLKGYRAALVVTPIFSFARDSPLREGVRLGVRSSSSS